ncbi:unnamed protein product [Adineta steineri]|uniref:Uncharacterized protein n=1 Tax=Adineta steineri TaxID=433720 RepID=A0A815LBH8_9BILA|nr:unnamed protein product [Adineta steineri]CAF1616374.1 unnamed protein product [Adineta steineri]
MIQVPVLTSERRQELHDGLPFGIFRRSGMRKFLYTAEPGYIGPNRKTVRQKIAAIYSSYTDHLRSLPIKIDFLALTSDLRRSS